MIRSEIKKIIRDSIIRLQREEKLPDFSIPQIQLERPANGNFGDYSTNAALQISKISKKNPAETAEAIKSIIENKKLFEKVEIAGPGFINFFISKDYLRKKVGEILKKGEKFGNLKLGKGKKIQIEFISANPTGPLTVGNARGGPFGDTLGNVFKKAGFKTEKAYYINDCGKQILALGHSVLKDGEAVYRGKHIDYLNKTIKEKDAYKAGQKAAKIIIEKFIKKTAAEMGIEYDEWFAESALHKKNETEKVLESLRKKGLLYEKEGACWFKSLRYGDERDRVVIRADGTHTYLAADIAYHKYKFEKKKFYKAINVWGADHFGDVKGLLAGVEALGHKGKLDIILLQFVTLFEKGKELKMSKRAGVYVTMDELLKEVGKDVVRFFFLQKSADTHLNFDLDLAKEQSEKNPVFYVQYAHARICSILSKSGNFQFPIFAAADLKKVRKAGFRQRPVNFQLLNHSSELKLIKQLIRLPEIIEDTVSDYQVQRLPQYALDLASSFHQFYRDCRVISENKDLSRARLSLILAAKTIFKNVLDLMGISAPENM